MKKSYKIMAEESHLITVLDPSRLPEEIMGFGVIKND